MCKGGNVMDDLYWVKIVTYIVTFIVIAILFCWLGEMSLGTFLVGCFWLIPFCILKR